MTANPLTERAGPKYEFEVKVWAPDGRQVNRGIWPTYQEALTAASEALKVQPAGTYTTTQPVRRS